MKRKKIMDFVRSRLHKQQRIYSIKDASFPIKTFELNYFIGDRGARFKEVAGLHVIHSAYFHTESQMIVRADGNGTPDFVIRESNYDDIEHMMRFHENYASIFKDLQNKKNIEEFCHNRPIFIFSTTRRKKNYYHVIIDDIPRLLMAIKTYGCEFDVLCPPDLPKFAGDALDIIGKKFGIRSIPFKRGSVLAIDGPILIIEDISKRRFYNFEICRQYIEDRMDKYRSIWPKPPTWDDAVFQYGLTPHWWRVTTDGGEIRVKNNSLSILPSEEAVKSLAMLKDAQASSDACRARKLTIVGRGASARPVRRLLNEDDLLKALPDATVVDFAEHSFREQMAIADQSHAMIGVSGSGLTNAAFLRPGSQLIDILPATVSFPPANHIEHICAIMGIHYTPLCIPPVDGHNNVVVDPEMLRQLLNVSCPVDP